jgi:hypothetical protein
MERLGQLQDAEAKVLADARALMAEFARVGALQPATAEEAVGTLSELRDVAYENLNQIQHEYLALAAVRCLVNRALVAPETEWYWNPRQTGGIDEPDLRGVLGEHTVVSAEVTTSRRPIGTILGRMQKTLRKLAGEAFAGQKYYFVRTHTMKKRAETIVNAEQLGIEVVHLAYGADEF